MAKPVRMVNVVPLSQVKVKVEVLSDDDEDTVACRACSKTFASPAALCNHVRMEHFELYAQGDPNAWTAVSDESSKSKKRQLIHIAKPKPQENAEEIRQKTQQILSSMSSGNLMSLASNDVSYIIIKEEGSEAQEGRKKRQRLIKVNQTPKEPPKKKEPQPITGPFECVQPSSMVADGICHQIFFSCCEYSSHYRDEHTRRRKGLRCQVCEKPLAQGDADRAPYTCEVCGAGFNASKELSEHTSLAHVKLKPFQCEVCHKRFTQQGGVAQHMRMHTGDRPFACTFCAKAFTQKSGLDQHLRIHTKVKPYRCVVCSKSFCQSVHLKQHMRTHTNVAPFQCGICQKRFKQSSHLNYHLRNHNPAHMTDELREKYARLVGLMSAPEAVTVEVEADPQEQIDQEIELEQVAAEQSIRIVEAGEGDEYILSDDGAQTWSVQLVEETS